MTEEWRAISGHPGYEVSDRGRVRSWVRPGRTRKRTLTPHILTLTPASGGHLYVALSYGQKEYVHRLVLTAFVGPCPYGLEACHWGDDPNNNKVNNLRWDTRAGNSADRDRLGTIVHGERCRYAKLTEADVVEIRRLLSESTLTQREIAARFDIGQGNVSRIGSRKIWRREAEAVEPSGAGSTTATATARR